MNVDTLFVNTAAADLRKLMSRLEILMGKMSEDQVWARGSEKENAVGNLALHLAGNVRQWIVSGLGGQPDTRVREREFSTQSGLTPAELTARLAATVEEAAVVISGLTEEQLTRTYEIQGNTVTGLQAVMNVVRHFAEHTGQVVFVTKNL